MTLKTNVLVWLDENILKTSEMFARSDEQRILKEKLSFKWYDKLKTATPEYVFAYREKGWNVWFCDK